MLAKVGKQCAASSNSPSRGACLVQPGRFPSHQRTNIPPRRTTAAHPSRARTTPPAPHGTINSDSGGRNRIQQAGCLRAAPSRSSPDLVSAIISWRPRERPPPPLHAKPPSRRRRRGTCPSCSSRRRRALLVRWQARMRLHYTQCANRQLETQQDRVKYRR